MTAFRLCCLGLGKARDFLQLLLSGLQAQGLYPRVYFYAQVHILDFFLGVVLHLHFESYDVQIRYGLYLHAGGWRHAGVYLFLRVLWFRRHPVIVHPEEECLMDLAVNIINLEPVEVPNILKSMKNFSASHKLTSVTTSSPMPDSLAAMSTW